MANAYIRESRNLMYGVFPLRSEYRTVINLFALAQNNAFAGEIFGREFLADVSDLFVVGRDAALLYQPARLALGGGQSAFDH